MYLDDQTANCTDARKQAALKTALVEHLVALATHVFMSHKPAKPSQSRWTGVAHVTQWALGLMLFHRLLRPLFTALSSKQDAGSNADIPELDADVQCSGEFNSIVGWRWKFDLATRFLFWNLST